MLLLRRHFAVSRSARRRACSLLVLCAYTVTATGVPLPAGTPAKSGELFPCAASSCGCQSAEACWRSCCCHTLAERLVWAREYGVTPPDFAIADAKRAGLDLAWLAGQSRNPSDNAAKTCCTQSAAATLHSCCQTRAASASKSHRSCCSAQSSDKPSRESQRQVVGWQAMKCNGQSFNWLAATPSLVADRPVLASFPSRVAWLGPEFSESAASPAFDLAKPPPELA